MMIRKVGYSCRDQAVSNLKRCYSIEALEVWRVRLTELYQVSKHPSILASMRLLIAATQPEGRGTAICAEGACTTESVNTERGNYHL